MIQYNNEVLLVYSIICCICQMHKHCLDMQFLNILCNCSCSVEKGSSKTLSQYVNTNTIPFLALYFNIKISGDLPALAKPDNADPRQNSIKKWLKCI